MSDIPYSPPRYKEGAFNCPYCNAYSTQRWSDPYHSFQDERDNRDWIDLPTEVRVSECQHCSKACLWLDERLAIPNNSGMPPPNEDMPDGVKDLYRQAANIVSLSPIAAAALLRRAMELLCNELGGKGKTLQNKVEHFILENKLPKQTEKMMDLLRKAGNAAAHPGEIDFDEKPEIAEKMFPFINFIANQMITVPKKTEEDLQKMEADLSKDNEEIKF